MLERKLYLAIRCMQLKPWVMVRAGGRLENCQRTYEEEQRREEGEGEIKEPGHFSAPRGGFPRHFQGTSVCLF